jgi:large subunit ribosomal protein L4
VAEPKAPLLDAAGKKTGDETLAEELFGAEVKPHLVHETVRAELNERRAGTRAAKSRGLVAGGRGKPWRQKGTGRARAGTTRAPQFTGGGLAFPPTPRSFEVKVNRKARRSALRSALSAHASRGTLALVDGAGFDVPSTKTAVALLAEWGADLPLLLVADEGEEALIKSFRNVDRVAVIVPAELDVADLVGARSLLLTLAARPLVETRAGGGEAARPRQRTGGGGSGEPGGSPDADHAPHEVQA